MIMLSINGLKGQQELSPEHRPMCKCGGYIRPEREKVLDAKAFALTGRARFGAQKTRAVHQAMSYSYHNPFGALCMMQTNCEHFLIIN